jgi:hypothetical protein
VTSQTGAERARSRSDRPTRVGLALIALWAACVASAIALFVNQFVFHGSGIGPGLPLGIVSLAVQAVLLVLVGRGSRAARIATVGFLVLAAIPLQMLGRLIAEGARYPASYTAAAFALKAVGVFLLFTGDSSRWFTLDAPHR